MKPAAPTEALIALSSDGVAVTVFLDEKHPARATCCDGRAVLIVVNRGGKVHCLNCDARESGKVER